jgi:pyruvate, orthophosphate dikinase
VNRREARVGLTSFKEGDVITIDGTSGKVYLGAIPTVEPDFTPELNTLLGWADEVAGSRSWPTPTPRRRPSRAQAMARSASVWRAPSACSTMSSACRS